MKHKVSELEGSLLDVAAAKAQGWHAEVVQDPDGIVEDGRPFTNYVDANGAGQYKPEEFAPSTDWLTGGPIVEREEISLIRRTVDWCADVRGAEGHFASTPLVAAMRAYVASKFGGEVDLP